MAVPLTLLLGLLGGIGLFVVIISFREKPEKEKTQVRLKKFKAKGPRSQATATLTNNALQVIITAALAFGAWYLTGWYAAALLTAGAGWAGPKMAKAPGLRKKATEEIEAYSQWAEQIRDLVSSSGSLYEAVTLSADNSPELLRPSVMQMTAIARTTGLPPALDWFANEMRSPHADRLVLGLRIAWDSGARVSEAFDSTARRMRGEVDVRRRNEVSNSRAWTQVVAILGVTMVSVLLLAVLNRGFFEPFSSFIGQLVLLGVGGLMVGSIFWVLKLSETDIPIRLLGLDASQETSKAKQEKAKQA